MVNKLGTINNIFTKIVDALESGGVDSERALYLARNIIGGMEVRGVLYSDQFIKELVDQYILEESR